MNVLKPLYIEAISATMTDDSSLINHTRSTVMSESRKVIVVGGAHPPILSAKQITAKLEQLKQVNDAEDRLIEAFEAILENKKKSENRS